MEGFPSLRSTESSPASFTWGSVSRACAWGERDLELGKSSRAGKAALEDAHRGRAIFPIYTSIYLYPSREGFKQPINRIKFRTELVPLSSTIPPYTSSDTLSPQHSQFAARDGNIKFTQSQSWLGPWAHAHTGQMLVPLSSSDLFWILLSDMSTSLHQFKSCNHPKQLRSARRQPVTRLADNQWMGLNDSWI